MFILTTLTDTVSIPPHLSHLPHSQSLPMLLNAKYANKILPSTGLCISLYDLLSATSGVIGYGTGSLNTNVTFSLLVFRPFKGEIITARVKGGDEGGIKLSLEFFDDIHVPRTMMFEGCEFVVDEAQGDGANGVDGEAGVNGVGKVWIWRTGDTALYFDPGTVVHVRVEKEMWDVSTGEDDVKEEPLDNGVGNGGKERRKVHYAIEASMAEPGLGAVDWW